MLLLAIVALDLFVSLYLLQEWVRDWLRGGGPLFNLDAIAAVLGNDRLYQQGSTGLLIYIPRRRPVFFCRYSGHDLGDLASVNQFKFYLS